MKKRILHVIYSLEIGGAEADLVLKVNSLKKEYEFLVVTLVRKGEFAQRIPGVKVINLGMKSKSDVKAVFRFLRIFFSFKPHVVHAHLFNAGLIARLCTSLLPVRKIYTVQMIRPYRPLWNKLADWLLQFVTNRIIAASGAIRDQLEKEHINSEKISIIYNSFDLSRFRKPISMVDPIVKGIPDGAMIVGTLCRLDQDKGLDYLVRAAHNLMHRKDLFFVLTGYGREEKPLRELINRFGLSERVLLAGSTQNPEQVYPQYDIYVLPSRTEGLGITLIEAMACGSAVIGSRVGGIPEIVTHGKDGLLFESGNVLELASCIEQLADDPRLRKELGKKARQSVERFDLSMLSRELHQVYQDII